MSSTAFNTPDDTLSTALSSACTTYDLAQVTEIVSSNQDNPSIEHLVSGLIGQCSSGGIENTKLFKAFAKYPHVKLKDALTAEFLTKAIQSSSTTGDFSLWEAMLASGWDINTDLGHNSDTTTISVMMDCLTGFSITELNATRTSSGSPSLSFLVQRLSVPFLSSSALSQKVLRSRIHGRSNVLLITEGRLRF
jgi:hypothetical protein